MSQHEETVAAVTSRVLADGAFIFAEPVEAADEFDGVEVIVSFRGRVAGGRMSVRAPTELGEEIYANLVGDAEGPSPDERAVIALQELTNMVAGATLAEVFGTGESFDLGIPAPLAPGEGLAGTRVYLTTDDGHPLAVTLELAEGGGT